MPGDEAVVWATMLSAAATRARALVYLVGRTAQRSLVRGLTRGARTERAG